MSVAWVGAGIAAVGVVSSASSAKNAANAQAQAAADANATQQSQYEQTRADQAPYRDRGNAAGDRLNYLLGLPGGSSSAYGSSAQTRDQIRQQLLGQYTSTSPSSMQPLPNWGDEGGGGPVSAMMGGQPIVDEAGLNAAIEKQMAAQAAQASASQAQAASDPAYGSLMRKFGASDFTADPGYDFRLSEGMRGINNSAAARGGVLSGAALKAASKYNQNFASNEYSNVYNRFNNDRDSQFNKLASIAGVGQTATNQVGAAGQNMANNVSQNQLGAGNARASGYIGQSNALTGGISQAYNMYQGNQLMNSLSGNQNQNNFWGSGGTYQTSGGYYPNGGSNLDVGNFS